jgi:hypothetical protein
VKQEAMYAVTVSVAVGIFGLLVIVRHTKTFGRLAVIASGMNQ